MVEHHSLENLLTHLAAIPGEIARVAEGRSEDELRARPAPGEWSIAEIFAHMRASDAIVTPRIYAILIRDIPMLIAYDERRWAEIARYEQLEFQRSLTLFTLWRAELVNILCSLAPKDWQRTGIHEELGIQNILGIVTGLLEHEEEHCTQLAARARR